MEKNLRGTGEKNYKKEREAQSSKNKKAFKVSSNAKQNKNLNSVKSKVNQEQNQNSVKSKVNQEQNQNSECKQFRQLNKGKSLKLKLATSLVVVATIIICICLVLQNSNKLNFSPTSEIARSMTYAQVQEGDENIERQRLCKV